MTLKKCEQMEDDLQKNGRQPQKKLKDDLKKKEDNLIKMEDDLTNSKNFKWKRTSKINKNGRRPQAQLKKSTLIGCDIIVN